MSEVLNAKRAYSQTTDAKWAHSQATDAKRAHSQATAWLFVSKQRKPSRVSFRGGVHPSHPSLQDFTHLLLEFISWYASTLTWIVDFQYSIFAAPLKKFLNEAQHTKDY